MTEKEIRENLTDAGCGECETESIMECVRLGNISGAEKLIGESRKKQLDRMHESQRSIDRLDYLCYRLKRG